MTIPNSFLLSEVKNNINKQEEWYYDVTGALRPGEESYVPDLLEVPDEWFRELPPWFGNVDQYSGWVSDGTEYDDKGRYAAIVANFEQCYLNWNDRCFKAIPVDEKEKFVYQGNVKTKEGILEPVSILAATKGHNVSDDVVANVLANQGFLDDEFKPLETSHDIMAHQLVYGRYMNVPQGIAFVGAVFPHVTASMVHRLNASAVSVHYHYDIGEDDYIFAGAVFVNQGAIPLRDKSQLSLRSIAASLKYNHIMAGESTCSCKEVKPSCGCKKDVAAATDPNLQDAYGLVEEAAPEVFLEDVVSVVNEHTSRLAVLEKEMINLMRKVESSNDSSGGSNA